MQAHTPQHIGQVWFDESGAEDRTISFLEDRSDELGIDPVQATVLDLGTGNASFLVRLREEGWEGALWGVDYSAASVRLARRVVREWSRQQVVGEDLDDVPRSGSPIPQEANGIAAGGAETKVRATADAEPDDLLEPALGIRILQHDMLAAWPPPDTNEISPPMQFELVHDKGTFDAISLSADATTACPSYRARVASMVKPGGLLLITSCNWTEEELERWIGRTGGRGDGILLDRVGRIGYGRYKFGGQEGGVLTGLCWRRSNETAM